MAPIGKHELSEIEICDRYITPAVEAAGWDKMSQIRREYAITKGRVFVRGLKRFSEHLANSLQKEAIGGAQPFVSLTFLRKLVFPLPPLTEQYRIVSQFESISELCATLSCAVEIQHTESRCRSEAIVGVTV